MNRTLFILIFTTILVEACTKHNVSPNGSIVIDGSTYPTVNIGSQTWTSVNYNGPGGVNYNDSVTNNPIYGKLYTYAEAEAIRLPKGWHLPTQSDAEALLIHYNANEYNGFYNLMDTSTYKLMATSTWRYNLGNNNSGLNIVASGVYRTDFGFIDRSIDCEILTTSYINNGEHASLELAQGPPGNETHINAFIPQDADRGSVRFVKDN